MLIIPFVDGISFVFWTLISTIRIFFDIKLYSVDSNSVMHSARERHKTPRLIYVIVRAIVRHFAVYCANKR